MSTYKQCKHNGKQTYVHRVVWEQAHGPIPKGMVIDHINGDRHDNRLENLRLVTRQQNQMNMKRHSDSSTGLKGCYMSKGSFVGRIMTKGKTTQKSFDNIMDCAAWLLRTRKELHGEFARH